MSAFCCSVMLKDFKKCFYEASEELRTVCWPTLVGHQYRAVIESPPPPPPPPPPPQCLCVSVFNQVQQMCIVYGGVCVSVSVQPHLAAVYSLFVWVLVCLNQMWKVHVHCVCVRVFSQVWQVLIHYVSVFSQVQ